MKRILSKLFSAITMIIMCMGIVGCAGIGQSSSSKTDAVSKETSSEKASTDTDTSGKNAIVVYFSCTGNTEKAANKIKEDTGADIYRIVPKDEYTPDDLDYNNSSSRTSIEQNDENARPEIGSDKLDLSKYDTVYIGYPIWWNKAPRIINTFMESYDFAGKNVIPFCTSGSSSIENSVNELKDKYPSISWNDGKRFE